MVKHQAILGFFKRFRYLLVFIILGAALRWVDLFATMHFFYDQGRDALAAKNILGGDFVLVGPKTDMPGLFFGPLWFYLLAFLYGVFQGNPGLVLVFLSFLDLMTIALVGILGERFFGRKAGIAAAFFWAVGALPVAYARTLANPAGTAFWTALAVFSLVKVWEGRERFLPLSFLALAVLFQLNAAAAFFFAPVVFLLAFLLRGKVKNGLIYILSLVLFLGSFLPQILFEIRNSFLGARAILAIFASSGIKEGLSFGMWQRWENFLTELSEYTFYGQKALSLLTLFLAGIGIFFSRPSLRKIFFLWFGLPLLVYFLVYHRSEVHPYYLLTWVPAAVLLLGSLTAHLFRKFFPLAIGLILVFIVSNYSGLVKEIVVKEHIAQPQSPNRIGLGDQLKVIDYIYQDAGGGDFGYYAYTMIPYWEDDAWQYLFLWYGKGKYSYLPSRRAGNPLYLIYEPDPYLPDLQKKWLTGFRSLDKGPVVLIRKIGEFTIEKFDKRLIETQ